MGRPPKRLGRTALVPIPPAPEMSTLYRTGDAAVRRAGGWYGRGWRHAAGPARIGGGPLVRRWIGARRRKAARTRPAERGAGAEIIMLTWAQTFGRDAAPADQRSTRPK